MRKPNSAHKKFDLTQAGSSFGDQWLRTREEIGWRRLILDQVSCALFNLRNMTSADIRRGTRGVTRFHRGRPPEYSLAGKSFRNLSGAGFQPIRRVADLTPDTATYAEFAATSAEMAATSAGTSSTSACTDLYGECRGSVRNYTGSVQNCT